MKIPTHQNNFQITWADKAAGKKVKDIRTLHISDPPFSLAKGTKPETVFRNSIEIWTGFHKDVMSDLYRHLVLSNSTRLDGKGGATARSNLDAKYPDRQTLPKLKRETGNVNTLGAIISILLEPREMHGEAYADAFSIVGGILASLL